MSQETSPAANKHPRNLITTILWTGLLVGILDASGAIISFLLSGGDKPVKIFQYIASAVFGKEAFSGNPMMAYLGILFHFIVAYAFTILFFLVAPKIKWMSENKVMTGILYGIFIWLVMNLLVLPLTNISPRVFHVKGIIIGLGILIIAIGLPLSFIAGAYRNND